MFDELVDDVNHWGPHSRRQEVLVAAQVEVLQWLPQHTGLGDVDGNEL